jgi:hypothetical protein
MKQLPPVEKPASLLARFLQLYWVDFLSAVILTVAFLLLGWVALPGQSPTDWGWLTLAPLQTIDWSSLFALTTLWPLVCLLFVLIGEIGLGIWFWFFWSERLHNARQ